LVKDTNMKKIVAVVLAAGIALTASSPASAWYRGGGYWGGYGGGYGYGGAGLGIALGAGLLGGILGGALSGGYGGYTGGRGYYPSGAAPGTWGPSYTYGPPTVIQRNYGNGYYSGWNYYGGW
jgi:hypothetical protein